MRFGSPLVAADASAVGCVLVAVCADSVYVVFLIGTLRTVVAANALFDAEFRNVRAGMVRREPIGLGRSARAAGSVGGIQSVALNARSNQRRKGGRRCVVDVHDIESPHDRTERDLVARSRAQRFAMGRRASGGARGCGGQCADRSQVAVALSADADLSAAVGLFRLRPFQPFRSGASLPLALRAAA